MHELNSLSSNDLSVIINSNTLIINLIEEDEIENQCIVSIEFKSQYYNVNISHVSRKNTMIKFFKIHILVAINYN